MGVFDAVLHRARRREAAELYRDGLTWLTAESTRDEATAARDAAADRAGEHLADRHRRTIDAELERRLSIEAAEAYGDALVELPLDAVIDGSWRARVEELAQRWSTWLQPEHRADQHWQAAEAAMRGILEAGRVADDELAALEDFLVEIDPAGPDTLDDPWYERFATARLEAGLLPRPRGDARLITQAGETIVFTEPGTVLEVVEELDGQDRLRTRTETMPARIDASDQRIAVFGDQLLFSTRWEAIVGVGTGEDAHGPYVRFDDATAHATHTVHTPAAELLAAIARELHRRTGA